MKRAQQRLVVRDRRRSPVVSHAGLAISRSVAAADRELDPADLGGRHRSASRRPVRAAADSCGRDGHVAAQADLDAARRGRPRPCVRSVPAPPGCGASASAASAALSRAAAVAYWIRSLEPIGIESGVEALGGQRGRRHLDHDAERRRARQALPAASSASAARAWPRAPRAPRGTVTIGSMTLTGRARPRGPAREAGRGTPPGAPARAACRERRETDCVSPSTVTPGIGLSPPASSVRMVTGRPPPRRAGARRRRTARLRPGAPSLEQEFGARQADAVAECRREAIEQRRLVDIDQHRDRLAVGGHRRDAAQPRAAAASLAAACAARRSSQASRLSGAASAMPASGIEHRRRAVGERVERRRARRSGTPRARARIETWLVGLPPQRRRRRAATSRGRESATASGRRPRRSHPSATSVAGAAHAVSAGEHAVAQVGQVGGARAPVASSAARVFGDLPRRARRARPGRRAPPAIAAKPARGGRRPPAARAGTRGSPPPACSPPAISASISPVAARSAARSASRFASRRCRALRAARRLARSTRCRPDRRAPPERPRPARRRSAAAAQSLKSRSTSATSASTAAFGIAAATRGYASVVRGRPSASSPRSAIWRSIQRSRHRRGSRRRPRRSWPAWSA